MLPRVAARERDGGRTIGLVHLTRPRSARPFTVDDVQRLDRLRPWIAHAFRRPASGDARQEDGVPLGTAGPSVLSGQMILAPDARIVFQNNGLEFLLRILAREPGNYNPYVPVRDTLPAPILKLLRQITGAANGTSKTRLACGFRPLMAFSPSKPNGSCLRAHLWQTPPGIRKAVSSR